MVRRLASFRSRWPVVAKLQAALYWARERRRELAASLMPWLLSGGTWNDDGSWRDNETWDDGS